MLPYWMIFSVFAVMAISRPRLHSSMWWLFGTILIFFVGLRYQVGGDWGAYRRMVWAQFDAPLAEVFSGRDPAYRLLNWIAAQSGMDIWFVNTVCAILLVAGLIQFIRRMPDPLLALTAATPYLIFIVGMGYTRQAAAIGALLLSIRYFEERRIFLFVTLSVIAVSFHQTALILLGSAALAYVRRGFFTFLILCVVAAGMYQMFLAERADRLITTYVESSYAQASRGGFIRVLMTAMAGTAFILLSRRMGLAPHIRAFWFWTSVMSLVFLALVTTSPTAIDRMGLYLLPIQVFVAGHICSAFNKSVTFLIRISVVFLYFAVLGIWLFFADNRMSWIPYSTMFSAQM